MTFPKSDIIWMNGKLVPWDDAKIHVGSHVIHYGSAVFEGMRCYNDARGPGGLPPRRPHRAPLQLREDLPDGRARTRSRSSQRAQLETVAANKMDACYIRPIVYRGYGQLGVNPFPCPVDVAIMVWDWGKYLGKEALETGVDVCVSSWARIAPNTLPAMAKTAANYMNSQLIKMEAIKDGYVGGHRPRLRRLRLRGQRREPVPREERHAPHAAARLLGPARHHARHRRRSSRGACGIPVRGSAPAARDALHRGRGLLHRHRRRDHARSARWTRSRSARARAGR